MRGFGLWVIYEYYSTDEANPSNYLDQQSRGESGAKQGQILWCIDTAEHHFIEGTYYAKLKTKLLIILDDGGDDSGSIFLCAHQAPTSP